jgi:hypothetical protein
MSQKNKDLFKEAIAEAKTIRATALINAKASIEEAFTPKIQEMFDEKISEMEDEDQSLDVSPQGEEDLDEDFDLSSILAELDEEDQTINENDDEEGLDEKKEPKKDDNDEDDDDLDDEDDKPASKPKTYSKPKSPTKPKSPAKPEDGSELDDEDDLNISDLSVEDLVKLVKDIISQETVSPGGTDDDINLDDDSTPADNLDAMGKAPSGDDNSLDLDDEGDNNEDKDLDEEFNLESLLSELDGLNDEDDMNEVKSDLNEALRTIKILRKELREANLVNSKLKHLNVILKEGQLNSQQKTKVINAFDKATNINEVKLVYNSLKTSMAIRKSAPIKESLFRNSSSKPAGISTKKDIVDVNSQMSRMQKLANIQ